ncbi:nitroreductase family protein [Geothermobacter hydrogeniphilus]|uniref:4Fe-4S ferredoxin-type domain-containing protein n=1 Tax=Geothermobacter hydrogeniphilus TaxID=1969733 RepID=A0A1X0Y2E3_9BACT|nr:nitroreductase family protein [Geothermobacter hydrogeniphilus]ORJ59267.1 hypothetical protein B5V00_10240 [Geothermobacter hydrogeniphilus]
MAVKHSLYHETGQVRVDRERCTLCRRCVETCPVEVLTIEADAVQQREISFGCIACGHCMMVCPHACISVTGRNLDPADLRSLPEPDARADAEALQTLFTSRRSVRRYRDEPVPAELLEQVVAMASTAPMGIPPSDVGVATVNGFEQVRELSAEVVAGYRRMMKVMRPGLLKLLWPLLGQARYERFNDFILPLGADYIQGWDEGRDTVHWGAPALLVFSHSPYAGAEDAAIACTYAMLTAEALGLGSCMIGGSPPILQRNKALCARLKIPEGHKPSLVLIVGYSAVPFVRTIKRRFRHEQGG